MPISKTLPVTNRDEWRAWLKSHHAFETEIWLIYYKKQSRQPRIPYDDAVEEALCYGWIMAAKKEETRHRRLQEFVSLLEQNKKLGLK